MIIIKVQGGLGNQLFQYALYYSLKKQHKNVFMDYNWFATVNPKEYRRNCLKIIDSQIPECTKGQRLRFSNNGNEMLAKIGRKLHLKKRIYREREYAVYDEKIKEFDNVYLEGYWQNPQYFQEYRQELKRIIRFPIVNDSYFEKVKKKIIETNSVSVHIRLGDYLTKNDEYGGICTRKYYDNALYMIQTNIVNPVFFVFSDEIDRVKEWFKGNNVFFVDNNADPDYKDFQLMQLCKHHIIANSSFSWWAAWLGQDNNSVVITPKRWNNYYNCSVACEEWTKVEG